MNALATISALMTSSVLACAGASDGAPLADVPSSPLASTWHPNADRAVVDRLVTARCDQEQSCNNIGRGAKFASREACDDQVRGNIGDDLNGFNCERGLDVSAVDRCMMVIKGEACSQPTSTRSRFDKCRTSSICMN